MYGYFYLCHGSDLYQGNNQVVKTFDRTKTNYDIYYCSCCWDKTPENRKCRDEGLFAIIDDRCRGYCTTRWGRKMAGDSAVEGARGSWSHHKFFQKQRGERSRASLLPQRYTKSISLPPEIARAAQERISIQT